MLCGKAFVLPVDSTTFNSSSITNNITLTNDKTYRIKGFNHKKNGAYRFRFRQEQLSQVISVQKGYFDFERGSKIYANGTAGPADSIHKYRSRQVKEIQATGAE